MLMINCDRGIKCSERKRERGVNFSVCGRGCYQFVKSHWSDIIHFLLRAVY